MPHDMAIYGQEQAKQGHCEGVKLDSMAKSSKILTKQALATRTAIGDYLTRRIRELYPNLSKSDAYARIGRDAGGLSVSTMRRLVAGKVGPTSDTLANLAHTLGCSVADITGGTRSRAASDPRPPLRPNQRPS
jgi:hypothetical protein